MLAIVTNKPETLIGVSGSWKTMPAAEMVTTALKMPQMESGTTEVRWRSANSADVMQKARRPGKRRSTVVFTPPCAVDKTAMPVRIGAGCSMARARQRRETNMMGVRKKRVLKGFDVAGWRRRRICVTAQRKPEKKAELRTRTKPTRLKATSPATIIITPAIMVAMMRMRRQEGASRRKRKAKRSTKARDEDLHIVRKVR